MRLLWSAFGTFALSVAAHAATLQEQYTAAQSAYDAGRMAEARAGFAAVLPRLDANPKMKSQAAVVRSRMGAAATALAEPEAGIALIEAALPGLTPKSTDWIVAELGLGLAAELAVDYDKAAQAYRAVLGATAASDGAALSANVGLVRALMFSNPEAARQYADAALAQGDRVFTGKLRDVYGTLLALRGRIELNQKNYGSAKVWMDRALTAAGGLGDRVSIADVRVRGDLALASYLGGNLEAARKYLAYTGVGSLPSQGFELGADMPLPSCAPVGDVARDDMAIVEFAIDDDGRVKSATPIYATRANAATEFARTVRGWSWRPAAAKALPSFWRQAVRLELRCANRGPESRRAAHSAVDSKPHFSTATVIEPLPPLSPVAAIALPALRIELARRIAAFGASSPQLLPVLLAIDDNRVRPDDEAFRSITSARQIADAAGAPDNLKVSLRTRQIDIDLASQSEKRSSAEQERRALSAFRAYLAELDAGGHGETYATALVNSRIALWAGYAKDHVALATAYRRVLATPLSALSDGDELRQTARLQLASVEAAAARPENARALLAETGLTGEQCSAFPIVPLKTASGRNGRDFPEDAIRWGFDGIVRVAFDIGPDGRPIDVRTIVASPPFVFDKATEDLTRRSRYQPIFRDGAAIACADQQTSQRYRIEH